MTTPGTILISFYAVVFAVAAAMLVDLLTNLPMRVWISCPDCEGLGTVDRDTSDPRTCWTCHGRGRFEDIDLVDDENSWPDDVVSVETAAAADDYDDPDRWRDYDTADELGAL